MVALVAIGLALIGLQSADPGPFVKLPGWSQAFKDADQARGTFWGEYVRGLEPVDQFLSHFVDDNRLRGAGLVVVKDNVPVYSRAIGFKFSKGDAPLNRRRRFRSAA